VLWLLAYLLTLGYLFYVRRYFYDGTAGARPAEGQAGQGNPTPP
jgi:hypothetical protein